MQTVSHEVIYQLLAKINTELNPSLLIPDQPLSKFGYDSLDKIGIVMALEEQYSLRITDTESLKLISVETIVNYVRAQLYK